MNVCMAQINTLVGDIAGNTQRVLEVSAAQKAAGAHVVVFPELTLTGYPPEDLLLRGDLLDRTEAALAMLYAELPADLTVVVGYPRGRDGALFNSAGVISGGKLLAQYDKQCLPNYEVFDEKRYFSAGTEPCVVDIDGLSVGLTICEDIWHPEPAAQAKAAGAAAAGPDRGRAVTAEPQRHRGGRAALAGAARPRGPLGGPNSRGRDLALARRQPADPSTHSDHGMAGTGARVPSARPKRVAAPRRAAL